MSKKTIVAFVLILCVFWTFSACAQLDRVEDQIENKVDRIEEAIENKLDPIEDAIEGKPVPSTNVVESTAELAPSAEDGTLAQEPSSDSVLTTAENVAQSSLISEEDAKNIALQHAKIAAEDVVFDRVERDFDRGIFHYEIEFRVGIVEYDYDIHAESGEILSFERD